MLQTSQKCLSNFPVCDNHTSKPLISGDWYHLGNTAELIGTVYLSRASDGQAAIRMETNSGYVEKWLTEQTLGSSWDKQEALRARLVNWEESKGGSMSKTWSSISPADIWGEDTVPLQLLLTRTLCLVSDTPALVPVGCCHSIFTFVTWEDVGRVPEWASDWLNWLTCLSPSSSVSWRSLMTRYLYSFSGRLQLCFLTRLVRGILHK